MGKRRHTLLASSKYRHLRGKVTISVETYGEGHLELSALASNIRLDETKKIGNTGASFKFTGMVEDASIPWVVLVIPNGKVCEALEVVDQAVFQSR